MADEYVEFVNPSETQKEFLKMAAPMELDLISYYNILEADMLDLLEKAINEGWTPERFADEVEEQLS